jgi:hypothetical protein
VARVLDAWSSSCREHVHHGACHCQGSSKTAPGGESSAAPAVRQRAVPLSVSGVGYSAAALTGGLAGCSAHVLIRLPAGSVSCQDAPAWPYHQHATGQEKVKAKSKAG